jgi:hypothetical protein
VTENKFRERRSAHRDESAPELDAPAPQPPASPSAAPEVPEAALAQAIETVESAGRMQDDAADGSGMDLDQLAGMEVPQPSFLELVEPHVEMALRFLGELPLTPDGERRVLPRWAKREIDLLGILEQRTRGNLPPEEQQFLEQALDQLRTLYLKVAR